MALLPMAIITLFWKDHIGLSLAEIMLLQGIFSFATLLMEYPSGYVSDRLGYRFALSLASLLGIVGWGLYTVAATFFEVMIAEILLGISFAFVSGSDSALLFETLKGMGREDEYTRFDGRMTGSAQAGEAAGAVFAGTLYAVAPLLPFIIQVGVWILALVVTRFLVEPTREIRIRTRSHLAEAVGICRRVFLEDRPIRLTIIFATFLGISSFYPVWLIQPYMQQAGVPLHWFGPIWAGANLTVALFSLLSHRVHFHLGLRGMSALFLVLIVAGYLGLGLTPGLFGFLFYYLLTAMRGLQGPLLRNCLQQASGSENRAAILSLKSLAFRLLFVCSGPLVGILADRAGLRPAFLIIALFLVLFLIPARFSFLRVFRERKQLNPSI